MCKEAIKNSGNDVETAVYLEPEKEENTKSEVEAITALGSLQTKGDHIIQCLTIIGQIEGHYILPAQNKTTKYEHVIPQIVSIEEDKTIEGLIVLLNTVGGDVEAGLAIAELLAGMSKPTVSLVLGGGHSIGVPLAVAANVSFIAPSGTMTIHPIRHNGTIIGVPQTMLYLQKMQERVTNFVVQNSGITPARYSKLMMNTKELINDVGTILDGEGAVKEKLIDHLGGLHQALRCLYELIETGTYSKSSDVTKKTRGLRS